ncbi:MAG TPA: SEC-C metal-binding domain-containing protein [Phycisphaerae bacterium]|nr:SEC-C metal-binding domain-containing protein [Phycisphaerae bacterium]HRY67606.1 SEC-C metal-binding domain-containing protein [Phycisphaerae bacterium]HSA24993.1 SEC-C metal-binding domain-containing protein [Phycisphaerae bacterium]
MEDRHSDLPWPSLAMDGKDIPWNDLHALANAAVSSDEVRLELLRRGTEKLDYVEGAGERELPDLTVLGVLAVIALGAERFTEPARQDLARQLLEWLNDAGDIDDDAMMEVIVQTTGRLGPAILEPLMQAIESQGTRLQCWFHAFHLLDVAEQANPQTRASVIRFCRNMLRQLFTRPHTETDLAGPAGVLSDLGDRDSLPFLREVLRRTDNPDIADVIEQLEGKAEPLPEDLVKSWITPVKKWLPESWESWRDWWKTELPDLLQDWEDAEENEIGDGFEDEEEDDQDEEEFDPLPDDAPPPSPIRGSQPKIGRNDPCPCGSGKKYKKCCGRLA